MKLDSVMNARSQHLIPCILISAACFSASSCRAPENLEITHGNAANADTYRFDIMLLSEWAGRILPERHSLMIYADKTHYYNIGDIDLNSDDIKNAETMKTKHGALLDNIGASHKDEKTIALRPFMSDYPLELACRSADAEKLGDQTQTRLEYIRNQSGLNIGAYLCSYDASGAMTMRKTWDWLSEQSGNNRGIYVGNGDSFGVSQRASALFNDLPTPQMLSLMGFDADTLGNHSFDNRSSYLQTIIDMALPDEANGRIGYRYVATNIKNAKSISHWLTRVNIAVPAEGPDAEPLNVAFIGALDSTIFQTTKTGAFGAIGIDAEMCSIVNELEYAYNENARVFFILGHILSDSESHSSLLNAIFTFSQPNIKNYTASGDASAALKYLSRCDSKIIVPAERLAQEFGTRNVSKLDFSDTDIKMRYAALIDSIRMEIFQGIVGVFGEVSSTPSFIAYYEETSENIPSNGTEWGVKSKDKDKSDPIDLFKTSQSCKADDRILSGYACSHIALSSDGAGVDHPIYYMQIPGQGTHTAKLTVSVKKLRDIDNGKDAAGAYIAKAESMTLVPVLSSSGDAAVRIEDTVIDIGAPDYASCESFMKKADAAIGADGSACSEYYAKISSLPKSYTSIDELAADNLSEENQKLYDPKAAHAHYETCLNAFTPHIMSGDGEASPGDKLAFASAFWSCLYHATSDVLCGDGKNKSFLAPYIYEFEHYRPSKMIEDRSRTTYNTNIISNGYFNYMEYLKNEGKSEYEFDVGLINSGTMREADFSAFTASMLAQTVPFDNTLAAVKIPVRALVPIIQKAVKLGLKQHKNDFGGFPSVSRLAIAYKIDYAGDNATIKDIKITEVWQTDAYGALTELLYLRSKENRFFAVYKINETGNIKITAEFGADSPWLCKIGNGNGYADCKGQNYEMTEFIALRDDADDEKNDETNNKKNDETEYKPPAGYYKEKDLALLTSSFLIGAGDEYPGNFGQKPEDVSILSDYYLRPTIYSYYNQNSQDSSSFQGDGIIDAEKACKAASGGPKEYKTIDDLTPKQLNCMLYLNHFFALTDEKERGATRWISSATDSVAAELGETCAASKLKP